MDIFFLYTQDHEIHNSVCHMLHTVSSYGHPHMDLVQWNPNFTYIFFPKRLVHTLVFFFTKLKPFSTYVCLIYTYMCFIQHCVYTFYIGIKIKIKKKRLANQQGHANHLQDIGGDWSRAGLQPVLDLLRDAVKQGAFTPDPLIPLQIEPSPEIFDRMKTQWLQTQSK